MECNELLEHLYNVNDKIIEKQSELDEISNEAIELYNQYINEHLVGKYILTRNNSVVAYIVEPYNFGNDLGMIRSFIINKRMAVQGVIINRDDKTMQLNWLALSIYNDNEDSTCYSEITKEEFVINYTTVKNIINNKIEDLAKKALIAH